MIALDAALSRLLTDRGYRAAFLEGRVSALDLAPEDVAAIATSDRAQLVLTADRLRADLLARHHRGSGGIEALYPATIAAWREAHPEDDGLRELMSLFLESEAYGAYRQYPFSGPGLSLEEAFHRFCAAAEIGEARVREGEFLTAMMKALLVSPDPAFALPAEVQRAPRGYWAVTSGETPILHAAASGRLIVGAITPFLAEQLATREPSAEVDRQHGVGDEVLAAAVAQLAALGLLEHGGG